MARAVAKFKTIDYTLLGRAARDSISLLRRIRRRRLGACLMGMHVVGPWPQQWRQSEGSSAPHMLFKELEASVVAVSLVAPFVGGKVVGCALDNTGVTFTLNSLSSGCAMTLQLLRHLADSLSYSQLGLVAGHAHRHRNVHTDELSHSLPIHV